MPSVVHRQNGARVAGDPPFNFSRINVQRVRTYIGENRGPALVNHCVCRGAESHGRGDRLVILGQSRGKNRGMQGCGSGTEADRVLRADGRVAWVSWSAPN